MIGDLGIEPHLNYSMRLKGLLVVMTTPSEESRRHLQFGCHHELAQRARDLQLKKIYFSRINSIVCRWIIFPSSGFISATIL